MGKTAVVTGGSAGIGLAIAERLARSGWNVAILARDQVRLDEARAMLSIHGTKIVGISADVADAAAVEAAAEQVEREAGPIDAWVNNAMSTVVAAADAVTAEEYARVTATTYLGHIHGTLAALKRMKPRRRGVIVQISSTLAFRPAPLQVAYCGAKAAVTGFTDGLRSELLADKIPVDLSVVYLPAVNTPQSGWTRNRTGREQVIPDPLYDPRLCAEAVFATIEKPQREIWVGRSTALAAIAQRLAPAAADRKAAQMRESMLGAPMAERLGNLDAPGQGTARIDGDAADRVKPTRSEYYGDGSALLIKFALAGAALGLGAVAGAALLATAAAGLPRLPR